MQNYWTEKIKDHEEITRWLESIKKMCNYDNLIIYDPIMEKEMLDQMVEKKEILKLNEEKRENSYLARSSVDDVARLESRTFICTSEECNIKPFNWRSTKSMIDILNPLLENSMENKNVYLIPFVMGPLNETGLYGFMLTDSAYATVNTGIMAKTGYDVIEKILELDFSKIVKCVHTVGRGEIQNIGGTTWVSDQEKYICHFPEENIVYSYGSGYGGNAILSKKCLALRIASYRGYHEGWYAEHMMLISLTNKKDNKTIYIAGAFPSACGKTNMAMLKSKLTNWEIKTLGDDITWLRVINGKLYGCNPETGFFGVAPNTTSKTNPVCMETIKNNTIFTNVGLTLDGDVCWNGYFPNNADYVYDWQGVKCENFKNASHPNARFTVRASQCPQWSNEDDKKWVPISAIIFGGKRSNSGMPLIRESLSFDHGILMGATLSSEATAAAEVQVGKLRYDPFAMLPFFGYGIRNYFEHWGDMKNKLTTFPKFYYINLFGKNNNEFIWPGFSENIHLLIWIYNRVINNTECYKTPLGYFPVDADINEHINFDKQFWVDQLKCDQQYLSSVNSPKFLFDQNEIIMNNVFNFS